MIFGTLWRVWFVEVGFDGRKLAEQCSTTSGAVRAFGPVRARKVLQRVQQLRTASNLSDLRNDTGRCHELRGDRAGQLSMDLDGPYRLIFRPTMQPPPRLVDGGLDWTEIRAVTVIEIADTHH